MSSRSFVNGIFSHTIKVLALLTSFVNCLRGTSTEIPVKCVGGLLPNNEILTWCKHPVLVVTDQISGEKVVYFL